MTVTLYPSITVSKYMASLGELEEALASQTQHDERPYQKILQAKEVARVDSLALRLHTTVDARFRLFVKDTRPRKDRADPPR